MSRYSVNGQSCESHLKPATHDHVAASEKTESPVSKSEKSTIKDEALCQHPAVLLGSEDNHESARSPFPVEEVKNSPVVKYSTSISLPSPCPVKHQDIEIEDECEFLIDDSSDASSTSWISIPTKNKKSKSNGSATPISKSQPSEKEKTQNKKVNRKVQVKAHTKQKLDHLDVGTFDFKEMSESDPIPESEENVLTSQSRKSTCMGKTKKDALRQDSPNQKRNTSWSGLETKPSYEEQCKTRMLTSEDLPMPSCGHQEEQTVSLKKSLRSSKNQQLASKASQDLDKKEQTAKQKLPKVENLETPVVQKLTKSKKPRNVLHAPESPVDANKGTPLEALQHPMESVKNPEKKRLSATSSEKIPCKIPRRSNKALCSSSEDTGSQTDTDSSSVQDVARKKPKLPDVKIKSNKRKYNRQHGPHGPVLEDYDKFASSTESPGQDDTSSDNSEDLNYKLRHLLSDEIARHKIVMPSNTPNVRRTKRIRLRPLEYWRGERINYTMDSSGGLVISGLVHPETESPRKSKKRKKDHPKQKRDKTNCINPASSRTYLLKNEAVDIYKDLNTSLFATGILILKPHKEKGHQCVHTNTVAFRIIRGEVIVTLHKTSYYLTAGDCFYVPAEADICLMSNQALLHTLKALPQPGTPFSLGED
ncbi:Centromere protein C, partial [Lamprotornis superbus]